MSGLLDFDMQSSPKQSNICLVSSSDSLSSDRPQRLPTLLSGGEF